MPWGVLVARKAGDMQCAVIFNLAHEPFSSFISYMIAMSQPSCMLVTFTKVIVDHGNRCALLY